MPGIETSQVPNKQRGVRNRIARLGIAAPLTASTRTCGRRQGVRFDRADVDSQHRQPVAIGAKPKRTEVATPKDLLLISPIKESIEERFGTIVGQLQLLAGRCIENEQVTVMCVGDTA